jgi:transcriptional regulator with GAF, ATPase, and Fis domain
MAHSLLKTIINYLEVNSAGMLLHRKDILGLENSGYLELISAYGYNAQQLAKKTIQIDEGLAGACLKEKKTMMFENVPESYYVESALGKARMTCLVMIPIKLHSEIIGVLEVSSFKPIDQKKIKLMEAMAENLASNIITLDSKRKIESMYKSSQEQAAQLREQEEEMHQQMEELQATQEESFRREKELTQQIEEYAQKLDKLQKEFNKLKKQK